MKILFLCGREDTYIRNKVLLDALSKQAEVINISSNSKNYFIRYLKIILKFISLRKNYDLIFIGFYGQPLVIIAKLLSRKPIIFDAFISTYQTLCFDRKKFKPNSLVGRLAFFVDKYSCQFADKIVLDTNAHINYFVKTFALNKDKFHRIFVGTDETVFYPRKGQTNNEKRVVFFYSEYQPLHGVEYIVKAAKLLKDTGIIFKLVGKGKEKVRIEKIANEQNIQNVEFIDWIQYKQLPNEIAKADLCIGGHLGTTEKAQLVIPGKTFQFIAMKKPTIIGQTIANRELFEKIDKPYYVEVGNSHALSTKVKKLLSSPILLNKMASEQYQVYRRFASREIIRRQVNNLIRNLD